jgi:hypothetical protein
MLLKIITLLFLSLAFVLIWGGCSALKRKAPMAMLTHWLLALGLFSLAAVSALGFLGLRGYHTFNYESLAAEVVIEPLEGQQFYAHFYFPDGSDKRFLLNGEELYVDAHILKWTPLANFLGLHTSYQLARVAGRYQSIKDEQDKPRTVLSFQDERPTIDLFKLRNQFSQLTFLVDTEYGSASFIGAQQSARLGLMISNSGLLFREIKTAIED